MADRETAARALSISDVARRIGKSEAATRHAIARGQIPSRKWGTRVVVLSEELDEFLRRLPSRMVTA